MYEHMIYGNMLQEPKPIEITIYTKLSESILNEQDIVLEDGGSLNLNFYCNNLKRTVIIHVRSMDCGGRAGNISVHGPSVKIKGEESNIGGGRNGIPILIPTKDDEVAKFDDDAITDPKKLKVANKKYKEVLGFVDNNSKTLLDIWNCKTPDVFSDLINKLKDDNTNIKDKKQ